MALLMTLGIFISAGTSVYASDQLEDSEVEAVAKDWKKCMRME